MKLEGGRNRWNGRGGKRGETSDRHMGERGEREGKRERERGERRGERGQNDSRGREIEIGMERGRERARKGEK